MHIFGIYARCDINGISEFNDFIDPIEYKIGGRRKRRNISIIKKLILCHV